MEWLAGVAALAAALRHAVRQVLPEVVAEAWPDRPHRLGRLVGEASTVAADDG